MHRITIAAAALVSFGLSTAASAQQPPVSLYGIALGQPLNLPACKYTPLADMKVYDENNNPAVCELDSFTLPGRDFGGEWKEVYFPFGHTPNLLAARSISVWLKGGQVQEIMVLTGGTGTQLAALSDLSQKFGKPSTVTSTAVQNAFGAQFSVVHAVWNLQSVTLRLDGAVGPLDSGEVEALTPDGAWMRSEEAGKITALSPHL